MWEQLKRIIKPNGVIVLFGSQPFTSALIMSNNKNYSHIYTWIKNRSTGFQRANSAPLRLTENVIVFSGRPIINENVSCDPIKQYKREMMAALKESGITLKKLNALCGFEASGYFRTSSSWANVLPPKNKLFVIAEIIKFDKTPPVCDSEIERTYNPQGVIVHNKINKRSSCGDNWSELANNKYLQRLSNYPTDILKFNAEHRPLHPTQKPVALMEYLIRTYTNEGETVLDFTMGSGTTGIACLNTNRNFIGIEKDDKYFKLAKERITQRYNELKKETGV